MNKYYIVEHRHMTEICKLAHTHPHTHIYTTHVFPPSQVFRKPHADLQTIKIPDGTHPKNTKDELIIIYLFIYNVESERGGERERCERVINDEYR